MLFDCQLGVLVGHLVAFSVQMREDSVIAD
jgi:hypothetical protein